MGSTGTLWDMYGLGIVGLVSVLVRTMSFEDPVEKVANSAPKHRRPNIYRERGVSPRATFGVFVSVVFTQDLSFFSIANKASIPIHKGPPVKTKEGVSCFKQRRLIFLSGADVVLFPPVPGGPVSKSPLGSFPPRRVKTAGFLRYITISCSSAFACDTTKGDTISPTKYGSSHMPCAMCVRRSQNHVIPYSRRLKNVAETSSTV